MREFLYVNDMAAASIFVMNLDVNTYKNVTLETLSHINIGSGVECSIRQLTETIAMVVDYSGDIIWDSSKPDGTPRKLMDVSKIASIGWKAGFELEDGLRHTYQWYLKNLNDYRQS
jgi:GDP-L-fucose synthase